VRAWSERRKAQRERETKRRATMSDFVDARAGTLAIIVIVAMVLALIGWRIVSWRADKAANQDNKKI
jgi:hypothetical protein